MGKWVFRIASSPKDGAGHISRSIAVGKELIKKTNVLYLICNDTDTCWKKKLKKNFLPFEVYKSDKQLEGENLIVDGYKFDKELIQWHQKTNFLVFFNDFEKKPIAYDMEVSFSKTNTPTQLDNKFYLYGFKYFPLSQAIKSKKIDSKVSSILISCGFFDSKNLNILVLDCLKRINYSGKIILALSSKSPNIKLIYSKIDSLILDIELVLDKLDLSSLYSKVDLVVTSGGVTALESLANRLPVLSIVSHYNQTKQIDYLSKIRALEKINLFDSNLEENLVKKLSNIINSRELRLHLVENSEKIIDDKGALRIVKALISATKL